MVAGGKTKSIWIFLGVVVLFVLASKSIEFLVAR